MPETSGGARVLLIEDDDGIREALAELLRMEGYDVVEVENGLEALRRVATARPDAILLDLMMPVMDGRAFVDALETTAPEVLARVPIVVLTAAGPAARLPQRARQVIHKPIDADHLLGTLEAVLGEPAAQAAGDGAQRRSR